MTQPTNLSGSFDTSLIDTKLSFSSTATNTSSSTGQENVPPPDKTAEESDPSHGADWKEISTDELYDQWADTYDSDGNILQFVDDLQMGMMLPQFIDCTLGGSKNTSRRQLRILDLGCGTGRNTQKLLRASWGEQAIEIHGWDSSPAMLELARRKCLAVDQAFLHRKLSTEFDNVNISALSTKETSSSTPFDGLISTLVLEHIDIHTYFTTISRLLKAGAFALVSNMHSDMGRRSRAGFRTASGERVKGTSFVYTVEETVAAAEASDLELVGDVRQRAVEAAMVDGGKLHDGTVVEKGAVDENARKWAGTTVWYGMLLRQR